MVKECKLKRLALEKTHKVALFKQSGEEVTRKMTERCAGKTVQDKMLPLTECMSFNQILIIDHADIIAMQDWSHVNTIIQQLNRVPDELPNATMRIRPWYLEEEAQFYRQTMILGSYSNKDILESFNRSSNYEGKMMRLMSEYKGVNEWFSKLWEWNVIRNFDVPQWFYETLQVFVRFTKKLRADDVDVDVDVDDVDVDDVDVDVARHDYFVERIFPRIKDSDKGGIMIFTSSHSESIKILEFLRSERASVYLVGDEDAELDFSSARRQFSERKIKIMLYTEKSHFDNRYQIDGVNYLIMYSLPERKEFYFEILKMLAKSENMACTALFSRLDKYRVMPSSL
ncbi:U3 small nucleolar RNA-associated protein, putative [Medicago truncatula]|uniref:U3 small nucleolar RNA-associated protein, putative n=1 Tax=Medicago truncatula TaxID=3880 RepID=A0A072U1K7_MEDTR|nr:U3 small nucleolar RNA-associated protein, putative [Medicago truncatula]